MMRVWLGLPTIRILPWHVLFRHNSTVMPLKRIYQSAQVVTKYKISIQSDSLSSFDAQVCGSFNRQRRCVTVSSSCGSLRKDRLENSRMLNSSESQEHAKTDNTDNKYSLLEETYDELMTAPKWLTEEEWSAVGVKFDENSSLSVLWPTVLLHMIAVKTEAVPGLYNVGMSLVDYVASQSDRHRLLRLVSTVAISVHQGGESHREKALVLYDKLCAEYDVFDQQSARTLISALAKTRQWRRCLELIDTLKITAEPTPSEYSRIIVATVVNGDKKLTNELLTTLSGIGLVPDDEVFLHMLDSNTAEQVLAVLEEFAWIPSKTVVDAVITRLQRY